MWFHLLFSLSFSRFLCCVPHKLCKVAVRECGGEKMDAATLSRFILSALQSLRLRSEKWRGCNRGITLRLPPPDELLSVWPTAVHPDLCHTATLVPSELFSHVEGHFCGLLVCVWLFYGWYWSENEMPFVTHWDSIMSCCFPIMLGFFLPHGLGYNKNTK